MRISDWSSDVCSSDLNLTWTFTLRDGQKFSDGSAVNAEAVKQSFERLLRKKQGPSEAFPQDLKVDAVDAHTVRFTRSEERRVGKECVSQGRSRCSTYH